MKNKWTVRDGSKDTVIFRLLKYLSILILIFSVTLSGVYVYLASQQGKRAEQLRIVGKGVSRPMFFAHRGGGKEAPENTIAAFENSAENGIDVLELDIRVTKDGELVVIHDSNLDRTTNGTGVVAETTLADIKRLDAGYNFKDENLAGFPFREKGVKIPTLEEVFERFPERAMNVELKDQNPALASVLCSSIRKYDRAGSVIVASTDSTVLEKFRSNCSGVATSASFREALWFLFLYKIGLSDRFEARMQALQIPENLLGMNVVSKDFIRAAHERGLKLHIWTANKKSDINRLVDIGVDGVMTDYPSLKVQ